MQYRFLAAYLPCSRSLPLVSPPVRKAVVYSSDASVNSSTRLSACYQIAHTAVHQEVLQIRGGDLRSRARHRQFCVESSSTSEQVSMEGDGIEHESTGSGVDLKQSQQPVSSRYGFRREGQLSCVSCYRLHRGFVCGFSSRMSSDHRQSANCATSVTPAVEYIIMSTKALVMRYYDCLEVTTESLRTCL
jgi:hypothetical protein